MKMLLPESIDAMSRAERNAGDGDKFIALTDDTLSIRRSCLTYARSLAPDRSGPARKHTHHQEVLRGSRPVPGHTR